MTRYRTWLVPALLTLTAVVLLAAGTLTWRMRSGAGRCAPQLSCLHTRHRHHPLRAELLWAGAALVGVVAIETAVWQRRRAHRF